MVATSTVVVVRRRNSKGGSRKKKKAILGLDLVVPRWDTAKPPGRMDASAAQQKRARS
ncbi:Hypothetical predicted protein [Olea europaea subsp. europaea]|uniref:Uncharacterized protein n=1 Tax=Olea europaea subsp. europaea TaxID=158383 RepID=A0A8S0U9E8_OLEEU|nr:Hypothetical predicted protein [Olea europaea subsp. europaea]